MKLLKLNRLLSGLLSLGLLVNMTMPAFAYNSTGSNTDLDNLTGEDKVQQVVTEYHDETDESTAKADIYITCASEFKALIPKTIILDGTTGEGSYIVAARGNITTKDIIIIEPQAYDLELTNIDSPGQTATAAITQDVYEIKGSELITAGDDYVVLDGSIQADGLRAGSWKGEVVFDIALNYKIYDLVLSAKNVGKIGGVTKNLVIPETFYDEEDGVWYRITEIATNTFYCNGTLLTVVIPDSVTTIGRGAFYACTHITSITIGNSVTSIAGGAFDHCTSATITVPSSATDIGTNAFLNVPKVIYSGDATGSPWGAKSVVPE